MDNYERIKRQCRPTLLAVKTTAVDVGCQRQLIGLSQALGLVVRKPSFTCTSAGNALQLFNVDRKLLKRM